MSVSDVNQVFLIGRLTHDMDLRFTTAGKAVGKFSIAVNKKRKIEDQWKDEPGFFEIVLWGQLAEHLKQYLSKGKQIAVVGELTQERWEKDGQKRSKVTVTASSVQLLGGSSAGSDGGSGQTQEPQSSAGDGYPPYEDIPF